MQPSGKKVKALLISVHYGALQPTLELLRCLSRMEHLYELHFLVVSNEAAACSRTELREALAALPNSELYEPTGNLGYFGAARFALDGYLANGGRLPDWVIVCNHDVLIEDPEFFERLFRLDPESAGVIAPRIRVSGTNLDQNPFMRRRPNWLRWASLRFIYSDYRLAAFEIHSRTSFFCLPYAALLQVNPMQIPRSESKPQKRDQACALPAANIQYPRRSRVGPDRPQCTHHRRVLRKILKEHFGIAQQTVPVRALSCVVVAIPVPGCSLDCLHVRERYRDVTYWSAFFWHSNEKRLITRPVLRCSLWSTQSDGS